MTTTIPSKTTSREVAELIARRLNGDGYELADGVWTMWEATVGAENITVIIIRSAPGWAGPDQAVRVTLPISTPVPLPVEPISDEGRPLNGVGLMDQPDGTA